MKKINALFRNIKENLSSWKNTPYPWVKKQYYVVSILKLTWKFNTIQLKCQQGI